MCFLKSDDCMVIEEEKKREKDTEADPREKKKEKKKRKRKKVERVWFCHDPYDFQLIYKKTI